MLLSHEMNYLFFNWDENINNSFSVWRILFQREIFNGEVYVYFFEQSSFQFVIFFYNVLVVLNICFEFF